MFPGRTLEELDLIDWPRFMRAKMTERILHVEKSRLAFLSGGTSTLSDEDARVLVINDELLRKYEK